MLENLVDNTQVQNYPIYDACLMVDGSENPGEDIGRIPLLSTGMKFSAYKDENLHNYPVSVIATEYYREHLAKNKREGIGKYLYDKINNNNPNANYKKVIYSNDRRLLLNTMESYDLPNKWPVNSKFQVPYKLVIFKRDIFKDYHLEKRIGVGLSGSYEDTYRSINDKSKAITLLVINAASYEESKRWMKNYMDSCSAPELPELQPGILPIDIGYGCYGDQLSALTFVCGNVFANIFSNGDFPVNLMEFMDGIRQGLEEHFLNVDK